MVLFGTVERAEAQGKPATADQIKAAFLYNFTRFVEWPPGAYSSPSAPFVICVVGNKPLADYLQELVVDEVAANRPISVHFYPDPEPVRSCNILFLSDRVAAKVRDDISAYAKNSTLTVSDAGNFLHWGGMVRFYTENNKIKIQINASKTRSANLQVSSKLLSVATKF